MLGIILKNGHRTSEISWNVLGNEDVFELEHSVAGVNQLFNCDLSENNLPLIVWVAGDKTRLHQKELVSSVSECVEEFLHVASDVVWPDVELQNEMSFWESLQEIGSSLESTEFVPFNVHLDDVHSWNVSWEDIVQALSLHLDLIVGIGVSVLPLFFIDIKTSWVGRKEETPVGFLFFHYRIVVHQYLIFRNFVQLPNSSSSNFKVDRESFKCIDFATWTDKFVHHDCVVSDVGPQFKDVHALFQNRVQCHGASHFPHSVTLDVRPNGGI